MSFPSGNWPKRWAASVGTIYLYFDNKDELLRAVVEESFLKLHESLRALPPAGSPFEVLRSAVHAYVNFGVSYPYHYRCAFALPAPVKTGKYQPHAAFDFLQELVQNGIKAGLFRSKDAELLSQTIWSPVHGLTSLLISKPEFPWAPKDKLIDSLCDMVISGLSAPAPEKRGKKKRSR